MAQKTRNRRSLKNRGGRKKSMTRKRRRGGHSSTAILKIIKNKPIHSIYDEKPLEIISENLKMPNELDNNIKLLINNSKPVPKEIEIGNRICIIKGGIRFGGRYPDIIIDRYDFIRGLRFLLSKNIVTTKTSDYLKIIVNIVRELLHTEQAVKYNVSADGHINIDDSWISTIDSSTICINKNKYNDNSEKQKYPNSLTNVTAIPYIIGDCREHAILATFLCSVYKEHICETQQKDCTNDFRLFYTTSYKVDDSNQIITLMEDHVFCLMISKSTIWVIDPLYSDDTSENYIIFNNIEAKNINKNEYINYKIENDIDNNFVNALNDDNKPILHCGNIYMNRSLKYKIINVPKIFTNSLDYIKNINELQINNYIDNVLIYNRHIKYDNYNNNWKTFDEWC